MKSLEEEIGFKFRNSLFLAEALTHASLAYETHRPHFDNQRLEFLGDAVIQLVLTDELYQRFPEHNEGNLTKLRAQLVSRNALAGYAEKISLGSYLMMGKGEEASGGRERASILADAFEALAGAIYLDAGLEGAKKFVLGLCGEAVTIASREPDDKNPKGQLQEILQAYSTQSPVYSIVSQEGPDHCKTFEAKVQWQMQHLGCGGGSSKKDAEIEAARSALKSDVVRSLSASPRESGCFSTGNVPGRSDSCDGV